VRMMVSWHIAKKGGGPEFKSPRDHDIGRFELIWDNRGDCNMFQWYSIFLFLYNHRLFFDEGWIVDGRRGVSFADISHFPPKLVNR